jgi:hypothetical protein
MQPSRTRFAQVPVEMVRKVATDIAWCSGSDAAEPEVAVKEQPAPAREGWREVAQQIQEEKDPTKMVGLVEKLITTFDREHSRGTTRE